MKKHWQKQKMIDLEKNPIVNHINFEQDFPEKNQTTSLGVKKMSNKQLGNFRTNQQKIDKNKNAHLAVACTILRFRFGFLEEQKLLCCS